jgi:hypothetical protein
VLYAFVNPVGELDVHIHVQFQLDSQFIVVLFQQAVNAEILMLFGNIFL